MGEHRSQFEAFSRRIYSCLLRIYPLAHRREYGELMLQTFIDHYREQFRRRGPLGLPGLWLSILTDTVLNAASEHIAERRGGTHMDTQKPPLNSVLYLDSLYGKCYFFALACTYPILAIYSYASGELKMSQTELTLSLLAAIGCGLATVLVGLVSNRAPVDSQKIFDHLADKREWGRAFWEVLAFVSILAFFLGSFEFLAEVHADSAHVMICAFAIVTCTFLLTAISIVAASTQWTLSIKIALLTAAATTAAIFPVTEQRYGAASGVISKTSPEPVVTVIPHGATGRGILRPVCLTSECPAS